MIGRIVGIYRRLFVYLRPYVGTLALGGVLALVVAAMEGVIAWLVKPALDDIFIRRDVTMLRVLPFVLFGAYLVKASARYGQSYLMAAVGERVIAALRGVLYRHIQQMPLSFFADVHSADLMSRVITDVNRLARVSSTVMVMAVRQVAMVVASSRWSSSHSSAWRCARSGAGSTGSTSALRRRSPSSTSCSTKGSPARRS